MKKCAILTITDGTNYGNRLQNYALQEVIKSLGYQVETIQRKTSHDVSIVVQILSEIKYRLKKILGLHISNQGRKQRKKKFDQFNQKYLLFSKYTLSNNQAPEKIKNDYDYFICGSDQIWNSRFQIVQEDLLNHLASFAEPNQKIAYAASFGAADIPIEYQPVFQQWLPTFKAIGVREYSGAELVKQLDATSNVQVVLDPTLLLEKDQWDQLAKKPEFPIEEKYILTYFLGGREATIKEKINELANKYYYRVIHLEKEGLLDSKIEQLKAYSVSPDEFVWLIQHAELVMTDSFHACVFSILYHRMFIPFQRKTVEKNNNMSSRLDTLFQKVGIQQEITDIEKMVEGPKMYDTQLVDAKLALERKQSIAFLKKALEE